MIGLVQTALKEMMSLQSSKSSAGPLLVAGVGNSEELPGGLRADGGKHRAISGAGG